MRQFFRNIFFIDFPARGAFAGIVLFVFGSWSYFSLLTASGKIHGMIFYPLVGSLPLTVMLLFLLPALFLGYALFTGYRFLFMRGGLKEMIRHPLALLCNKICLSLAFYGLYHSAEVFFLADMLLSCHGWEFQKFMLPEPCRVPAGYSSVFFLFLWLFSTAKLLASAEDLPVRKMFGKTVRVILVLWLGALIFTNISAYVSRREFLQKKRELEKVAGTPLDVESFCKRYYGNRKPDPEFRKKADRLQKYPEHLNFLFVPDLLSVEPDRETLKKWQKELLADNFFKEWDTLLSHPLPLREQHIKKGCFLIHFRFDSQLRGAAILEYWRLRFAIESRDTETIIDALEKMHHCSESLIDYMWQPAAVIMMAVETYRIKALERVIAADLLSDGQLLRQKTLLSRLRKHLVKIRENILYAEAVIAFDVTSSSYEKVQKYRFLFPGTVHLWNKNQSHIAQAFLNAFSHTVCKIPRDSTGILASGILPDFANFDIRQKLTESLCLALEKVIDLHLYKRRKGTYPDNPETLPEDPFTGREMLYYKGELSRPRISVSLDSKKTEFIKTPVIAVLSCGKNGTSDIGKEYSDDIGIYIPLSSPKQNKTQ